ncbi:hypothetical protein FRC00_002205 [Tulasnella sp. 408]|nr:hypothetical protein FRC00_002205 [Tulasnella sp. 408]
MIATPSKLASILTLAISAVAAPLSVDVEFDGQAIETFAQGRQFRRLVVFGDSFSDDGHGSWVVSNHTWPVDPAYYQHTSSNGPVWPTVLSQLLGVSNKLTDKATSGATSDNAVVQGYTGADSTIPVPSALDQIAQYISQASSSYDQSSCLYAIVIGANDIFFDPSATAVSVIEAITKGMKQLQDIGASNFILASYPNLALLPFAKATPESYQAALSAYSKALADGLSSLAKNPPKSAHIAYVDLYNLFPQILANPKRYGFSPDVFSDIYHPSGRTNKIIAAEAVKALAKVF